MGAVLSLATVIVAGVIVADLISAKAVPGTASLLGNVADFWKTGVSGMLGQGTPLTPGTPGA